MHKIKIIIKGQTVSDIEITELPEDKKLDEAKQYVTEMKSLLKAVKECGVASGA